MSDGRLLTALDGSNPLAFLTALGTLRLLQLEEEQTPIKLRWIREGVWRPEIHGVEGAEEEFSERVLKAAKKHLPVSAFEPLGKNITVDKDTFAKLVTPAYESARQGERLIGDFAASFGCEICEEEKNNRIERTDLCFINGSGHQHFLGFMQGLVKAVTTAHVQDALFGQWKKDESLSMRWDPADAAEYAFRWSDPGKEGASSVWGANLLAVHALPLFPTQPTEHGLRTTGFREGVRGQWPAFSWPLWTCPITLDTVRSLLGLRELQCAEGELDHRVLRARGIEEVYRAPRVEIGRDGKYKVSFRPAKAV